MKAVVGVVLVGRRTINKEIAINGGGTRRASEIAEKH